MNTSERLKLRSRLNRVSGQVTGIQKMIDDDRYCVDILTQISAARSALDKIGVELLSSHIENCVIGCGTEEQHKSAASMTKEQLIEEVHLTLSRFLK